MPEQSYHPEPVPQEPVKITSSPSRRRFDLDNLRSFVTLLVVFHHSSLAYVEGVEFAFSPVIDGAKWDGFLLISLINDSFFMFLMFLISGLFVWDSIKRKGVKKYIYSRLMRLGIPFVLMIPILNPIVYYTTSLELSLIFSTERASFLEHWIGMAKNGFFTSGPFWFIWVLLLFDLIVALVFTIANPKSDGTSPESTKMWKKDLNWVVKNPFSVAGILYGISFLVYIPMVILLGPSRWIGIGPFSFQVDRILMYFAFFSTGCLIGAKGLENGMFKKDSKFTQYWWIWLLIIIASIVLFLTNYLFFPPIQVQIFILISITLSFGFSLIIMKVSRRENRVLKSLSANAYGIYLFHYATVVWIQYGLLFVDIHPILKGLVVFIGSVIFPWGLTALLRLVPGLKKIL